MNPYAEIFRILNSAKIKYLIVGGVAVNLYGYSRFTGDIDILLALDKNNLLRMDKVMKKMKYAPRLPVEIHELGDKKKVKEWMKTKGLKAYTFISQEKPQLDIDIVVEHSFIFPRLYNKSTVIEAWGIKVPVISLHDLIGMKKRAGRDKDIADLKILLALKGL